MSSALKTSRHLIALALLAAATATTAQVECCALPNQTVSGFINNDVIATGCSCTIARSGSINGNLEQLGDGSLVIRGLVNGGVSESGLGNLTIDRGYVKGDSLEADAGSLIVREGSIVEGALFEFGSGNVNITTSAQGPTKGDVEEEGLGSVIVSVLGGAYEGNIHEFGAGTVEVAVASGATFKSGIAEDGAGRVQAQVEGAFEGNIEERGDGDLVTEGSGLFKGNTEHEVPGLCRNTIVRFEGAACAPL
jgi:hypothetical protein